MEIIEQSGKIILKDCKDFEPEHIFECGQCFRFDKKSDGSYTIVANGRAVNVSKKGEDVVIKNTGKKEYDSVWKDYFDMDTDYGQIKQELKKYDEHLSAACDFAPGIRILNQDFHEMVISFIISARNSIPSIKKCVLFLSEHLGEKIGELEGDTLYSFPTLESIANADMELLKQSKAAFRAPYIKGAAQKMLEQDMKASDFDSLSADETSAVLQTLPGVGPKVADCIALFSLKKHDAFPVDVWVKRVMEEFYTNTENEHGMSLKKMRTYAMDYFKDMAGYAQQYLFYYARQNGIGKKVK